MNLRVLPDPDDDSGDTPEPGDSEEKKEQPSLRKEDDSLADLLDRPWKRGINNKVRYDHARQRWHYLVDETSQWRPDTTEHVRQMVRDRTSAYLGAASSAAEIKILVTLLNESKKTSVLQSLRSRPGIAMHGDEWDPHPHLLGVGNGIVDLTTGELVADSRHHRPDLLVTKSTNIPYNPNAQAPRFLAFLSEIAAGDEEIVAYLLRVFGYALFGLQKEQKFWLFVGQGNNGKGTLTKVIAHVMGDYAMFPSSALYMRTKYGEPSSAGPRADLVALHGMRFTPTSEPVSGAFNDELVKAHTGDDPIRARALHSNVEIQFRPSHTLIFSTNNPPRVEDVGKSMQRRARVVHFTEDFSGARMDPGLEDKLRAESEGILNYLIWNARDWYQNGLREPEKVLAWSAAYIEENDPLSEFVYDRCVRETSASVQGKLLFDSYQDWAARNDGQDMSATSFGLSMGRRFRKTKTGGINTYLGLRLKSAMELAGTEPSPNDDD